MGMTHNYDYDIAFSFAGKQRDYVREVAKVLAEEYGLNLKMLITSKKIGIDNGNSVVLSLGNIFKFYVEEE